jgi:hypothetical protein
VGWTPRNSTGLQGGQFTLQLRGTGFAQTTEGGGVTVSFNPSILRVVAVSVDAATWEFFVSPGTIDNTTGSVRDIAFASFAGRSGDFPIASVTFEGRAPGFSPINLAQSTLNPFAGGGQLLPLTLLGGSRTVTSGGGPVGVPLPALGMAGVGLGLLGIAARVTRTRRIRSAE